MLAVCFVFFVLVLSASWHDSCGVSICVDFGYVKWNRMCWYDSVFAERLEWHNVAQRL
jgi:hypothetical protein